ncbi:MAG TPA: hypothetical protein VFU15_11885 [Bacteroidia bacterium]|nr:hypothetical protein [Bacteroidia bacterium]
MKLLRYLFIFAFLFILPAGKLHAQLDVKDSVVSCGGVAFSYALQDPAADMADRFGLSSAVGAAGWYKTKKNLLFDLRWSYIFGKDLRQGEVLDSILTSDGHLIDREGKIADIREFERGFTLQCGIGKIFNNIHGLSPNPNCGIILSGDFGYMQHKIRIYDNGARAPQLAGDYLKGYDRLTGGFAVTGFLGYWYMSKSRYVNCFFGVEATQAFTHSLRSWDFETMAPDTKKRNDELFGFRVGWNILIYQRSARSYYLN